MKYELTDETKVFKGVTLRRARYLDTGELGGWIESEKNLSQEGKARVFGEALVFGKAQVFGEAQVSGKARVFGDAQVSGKAQVSGEARVFGGEWEESPLQIQGTYFFFSVSSTNTIAIGCQNRTVEEWLESYEEEFEANRFTEKQRSEYKRYFNLAADMYGWNVPRLAV